MSTTTITTTPPAVSPPAVSSGSAHLSPAALEEQHHLRHLRHALTLAWQCTPTSSAFCVGAVLLSSSGTVLSTGYSRELPDNTHAEQVALMKLGSPPPEGSVLYTTMEPCAKRTSGDKSCVERIVDAGGIGTVVVGVKEPNTFVQGNQAKELLEVKGIKYLYVPGLEREILVVAERSHKKEE
ncbi:cytidine deaminase-like protein [Tricharina praecox]|uniref:cytidine deaminase-like protein n=1 Tax=Tricharina praecox TaxID=43433 RepID=UPI00221F8E44|nr:cytidine deaminase-like protein [Tricharina praecox]KAI5850879.1 cytidine deaminase-like protein [Tricharina praecox]